MPVEAINRAMNRKTPRASACHSRQCAMQSLARGFVYCLPRNRCLPCKVVPAGSVSYRCASTTERGTRSLSISKVCQIER